MSDAQSRAEQLDEEELPSDLIPEKFIEAEDWDQGAGADEADDDVVDPEDSGLEHESPIPAEEAAMHIERGISEG